MNREPNQWESPEGTYLTLEADRLSKADDDYHSEISEELAHQIRRLMAEMIGYREEDLPSVLVVGLGNDSVTPDSLGPRVLDNLQVTRHLDGQYGEHLPERQEASCYQRHSARSHGADRHGDGRDFKGNYT